MGKAVFLDKRILGKSEFKNGKLDLPSPLAQPPRCPECTSQKVWRDGLRYTKNGDVQRYLCRSCGYRFSQSQIELNVTSQIRERSKSQSDLAHNIVSKSYFSFKESLNDFPFLRSEDVGTHKRTVVEQDLNSLRDCTSTRQVCVSEREAKNLSQQQNTREKQAAGATTKPTEADIKGYLTKFAAKQLLMGLEEKTVKGRFNVLRLLIKRGANLFNPESVFKAIDHAKRFNHKTKELLDEEWADGSKNNASQAYRVFCEIFNIQIPPHINFDKWTQQPQKLPWIPLEREVDELIAGSSRKVATFLQLLKETGARSGEAWRLKWIDIDMEHGIVTYNLPEKGSNPRQFKVSQKSIAMLNMLPKTSQKIWGDVQLNQFRKNSYFQRKRIAHKLQNPRIERITFHTLRHFYGTMEYHRTKDILHVKERLGHRSITSTLIYTHLVNFEADEYHTATAKSLKEDEELLQAGFEYVTERDGIKIYRKRK